MPAKIAYCSAFLLNLVRRIKFASGSCAPPFLCLLAVHEK